MMPEGVSVRRHMPRIVLGAELTLIAVAATFAALAIWAVATPRGPVGSLPPLPQVDGAAPVFAGTDAVFGIRAAAGDTIVSDIALDLYGVRLDRAGGASSAIVGGADEPQRSYRIGEELAPGVKLVEVRSDHIILERGGRRESLYLDQAAPAARVGGAPR